MKILYMMIKNFLYYYFSFYCLVIFLTICSLMKKKIWNPLFFHFKKQYFLKKYNYSLLIQKYLENEECSICLEKFKMNELIIQIKCNCNNIFHEKCIIYWLKMNQKCPFCQFKL